MSYVEIVVRSAPTELLLVPSSTNIIGLLMYGRKISL
jgi:hypothetical protein